jgi:hypothetical protein
MRQRRAEEQLGPDEYIKAKYGMNKANLEKRQRKKN